MSIQKLIVSMAVFASINATAAVADTSYPARAVTLVVNYPAGGGSDAIARALASAMTKTLKHPVPVENVAGGNATRGVTDVVTAPPDGYRIGLATNSPMTIAVHSVAGLPWSTPDTYDILGGIGSLYNAVCAQPDTPYSTLDEMVKYAKAHPGELTVASIAGGLNQYTWDQFIKGAQIKVRFVPYSGDADGLASFLGKNTQLVNLTWPGLRPHADAGKAKCLALFAPERISSHPNLPTFKELGYDVTTTSDYVVYAPKGMPRDARNTLILAIQEALKDPDLIKVLATQNVVVNFTDGGTMTKRFSEIYRNIGEAKTAGTK